MIFIKGYVVRNIISSLVTLLVIIAAAFLITRFTPGDPSEILLGDYATPELVNMLRKEMELDKPLWGQYISYMKKILRMNLGTSFRTGRDVATTLLEQYPYTLHLCLGSIVISILVGIPLGTFAAIKRKSWFDRVILPTSVLAISTPMFWLGLLVLFLFAIYLEWFPLLGAGNPNDWVSLAYHLILPAFVLGLREAAIITRMTRATVIDVLDQDYIRTARAKGLTERAVIWKYAIRNSLNPIVSIVGLDILSLLGGSVIAEVVFSRPGVGRLLVDSISARDYPMVQGAIFFIAFAVVIINLLTDIFYRLLDPRIELE